MTEGPATGATPQGTPPEGVIPYPVAPPAVTPQDPGVQQNQDSGSGAGPAAPVQSGSQGTGEPSNGGDLAAQLAHWKEMSRKNEERAKSNADKAKQFDEFQESQKTELQKAQDRAAAAEQEVAKAQTERHQLAAIAKYQLDAEFAPLLGPGTQSEIEARAERISQIINARVEQVISSRNGNGQPQRNAPLRPVESLRPGSAPSNSTGNPQNPDQMFRDLIRGRGNG